MTKKIHQLKHQQILSLNWDANRKRAKAINLSRKLFEAVPSVRFTKKDYEAFYRSLVEKK